MAGVKSKWLGRGVKEGKVLLLSLEDSIEVVLEHLDNLGAPDDDILILENPHMPQEGCYEWIQHMIIKHKPVLVIIETVIVFAQRKGTIDANDYTTTYRMLKPLSDTARKTGCHIMVIHHANKKGSEGTRGNEILGSAAFTAVPDTIISLGLAVCRTWVLQLLLQTIIQAHSSRQGVLAHNITI